ncbi:MAG: hypothetical protein ACXW4B_10075 [Micavibrio sp.]
MTAELLVMNNSAVVLAADSAVTLSSGNQTLKTYLSGNKLFSLSYKHPVGIMFYQNTSLHTVPWETIIKVYRSRLGAKTFKKLEDYAEDFLRFLDAEQETLFPKNMQEAALIENIHNCVFQIWEELSNLWNQTKRRGSITKTFVNSEITSIDGATSESSTWYDDAHKDLVIAVINDFLKSSPSPMMPLLFRKGHTALTSLLFKRVSCTERHFGYTGLVFAGFGDEDIFPAMRTFEVGGYYLGRLRIENDRSSRIAHGNEVSVIPFAQTDMVATFMKGISPTHEVSLRHILMERLVNIPIETIDNITDLTDAQKMKWKQQFFTTGKTAALEMMQFLTSYFNERHTANIIQGLKFLTKDELAFVAQAMLSLSTLQKKVSPGDDSVGGPIDSAVISKGDGFIWMNRKHYFKPEMNPHFFTRFSEISARIEKLGGKE